MEEQKTKPLPSKYPPFSVIIEAQAVIDYMSTLRGMTKDGNFYEGLSSLELSRFASFDGSDWQLPESFEIFLDKAAKQKNLFSRARPYDFAAREIAYLTQNYSDIKIYVPPELVRYHNLIDDWCIKYLPGTRTVSGNINDINTKANVWVARSPQLAHWLIDENQPFILCVGKENREINNAIRSVRWDQTGFFLRQAEFIYEKRRTRPTELRDNKAPRTLNSNDHRDLALGYEVFLPPTSEAVLWVGEQKRLSEIFADRTKSFTHDDGTPLSKTQITRTIASALQDIEELDHRIEILSQYHMQAFEQKINYPQWSRYMLMAEFEMQNRLREIEQITKINPITGKLPRRVKDNIYSLPNKAPDYSSIGKQVSLTTDSEKIDSKIVLSLNDFNIPRKFQAVEIIEAISELVANGAVLRGKSVNKSNITGSIAEDIAAHVLHKNGWDILLPITRVDKPQSGKRNGDIRVDWIDQEGNLENGMVDLIARDPNGDLCIVEIKAKRSSDLSTQQKKLRAHLNNGGRILNPNCAKLRKDQKTFGAKYVVVVFDQILSPDRRRRSSSQTKPNTRYL